MHLLRAALILLVLATTGLILSRVFHRRRLRIPEVAVLIGVGVLAELFAAGVSIPLESWVHPLEGQGVLTAAAAFLIFYGGAELNPGVIRHIWLPIAALATVGVAVTTAAVGLVIHTASGGIGLTESFLIGAILAGTDPAVLVSLLDEVRIRERVRETLIAESALNDPISALISGILLVLLSRRHIPVPTEIGLTLLESAKAVLLGAAFSAIPFLERRLGRSLDYAPKTLLAFAASYFLAGATGANPFLAAFVSGYFGRTLRGKKDGAAPGSRPDLLTVALYAARSYVFILLGLSLELGASLQEWTAAFGIALTLVLFARPLAVLAARAVSGRTLTRRETVFLAANRQTGVIPSLLASFLAQDGVQNAAFIRLTVMASVLLTSVALLPAVRPIAARLDLLEADPDLEAGLVAEDSD